MNFKENSPTLLVLAAGLGSRFGGLKQLEQIGPSGETLMDYSIYDAHKAGFTRVVFLIRKEMREQFESQVGYKYGGMMEVEYAYQEKSDLPAEFSCPSERSRPWGTGHAVWAARHALQENFFAVINADDYYGAETFNVLIQSFNETKKAKNERSLFSMVGFRLSETLSEHGLVSRGICQTTGNFLQSVEEWSKIGGEPILGVNAIGEKKELSGAEIVSMNVWGFSSSVFELLELEFSKFLKGLVEEDLESEFYLPAAVDAGIRSENISVKVYPAACAWMGVTFKEDKEGVVAAIAELVNKGVYPDSLKIN